MIPNDVFIHHLCKLFNINRTWLQTGDGDIYLTFTTEDQHTQLLGRLLATNNELLKELIIKSIDLDDRDLDFVFQLVNRLLEDKSTSNKGNRLYYD